MKTPKEYTDNLKNGIITTEMLRDALFSVNKRAKNYRDAERKCRVEYYGRYSDSNRYKKEQFYKKKEKFLSLLEPVCIHREFAGFDKIRIYDYEDDYSELYVDACLQGTLVWENCYYDYDFDKEVNFFDYQVDEPKYRYYLYYVCGNSTFHSPINISKEKDLKAYDLSVVDIEELETNGREYTDLISMQFVDKLLNLIASGSAEYRKTLDDRPPLYLYTASTFEETCEDNFNIQCVYDAIEEWKSSLIIIFLNSVEKDTLRQYDESEYYHFIHFRQKEKKKKNCMARPDVKITGIDTSFNFLLSRNVVKYVMGELENMPIEERNCDALFNILTQDGSPVKSRIEKTVIDASIVTALSQRIEKKANKLYKADRTRPIEFSDGEVRYAE